jgi:hypothetical protein
MTYGTALIRLGTYTDNPAGEVFGTRRLSASACGLIFRCLHYTGTLENSNPRYLFLDVSDHRLDIRLDQIHVLAAFHRYHADGPWWRKRATVHSTCAALEIHAQLEAARKSVVPSERPSASIKAAHQLDGDKHRWTAEAQRRHPQSVSLGHSQVNADREQRYDRSDHHADDEIGHRAAPP